jgi:hypothetical protein
MSTPLMSPAVLSVVLDEAMFRALVAGLAVTLPGPGLTVRVILADLGWQRMNAALNDAIDAQIDEAEHDRA